MNGKRAIKGVVRAVGIAALVLLSLVALLLGSMAIEHGTQTTLPTPAGPFAVGRTTFDWVDSRATDELARTAGARREVFAWVWYPAARSTDATVVEYLPASWRVVNTRNSGVLMSRFLTRDLSQVHAHSLSDAALAPTMGSLPVVILRAGGGALTTSFTTLAEDLASRGYVVVGFDAPYLTSFVVLSGGRVLLRPAANDLEASSPAERIRLAERLLQVWCADTGFVLDQLQALNASDPSGRFTSRLDLQRVGVMGHSFGGATAAEFCHHDIRCKVGIDLDGMLFGSVVQSGLHQPFMFVLSDQDASAPEDVRALAAIQSVYDRLAPDSRLMIKILGTNHFSFSDQILIKSHILLRLLHAIHVLPMPGRHGLAITADYVGTFFDVHLRGQPATRLQALGQKYPEARVL